MGGNIWVESDLGEGSLFTFTVKVLQSSNINAIDAESKFCF
jgi:signal transduction histidine kinase